VVGLTIGNEGIAISRRYPHLWDAVIIPEHYSAGAPGVKREQGQSGLTPLVAAMRCYVAARLVDYVDVPKRSHETWH
jgi:hypothetical protein